MPVYLCQPGASAAEPWRHGIQVYAAPFAMDAAPPSSNDPNVNSEHWVDDRNNDGLRQRHGVSSTAEENPTPPGGNANSQTTTTRSEEPQVASTGVPIRRVRHAEIVLVDDVCIAFDRYWLRLRWPGNRGGFAGYIAMGKISDEPTWLKNDMIRSRSPLGKYELFDLLTLNVSWISISHGLLKCRNSSRRRDERCCRLTRRRR